MSLSLEKLGEEDKTLVEMLEKLHHWFDEFADGKTTDHRKIRHHQEGIEEITKELTEKYGTNYQDTILSEAQRHVRIDTYGKIPLERDYKDPFFFQKLEHNSSSSWI